MPPKIRPVTLRCSLAEPAAASPPRRPGTELIDSIVIPTPLEGSWDVEPGLGSLPRHGVAMLAPREVSPTGASKRRPQALWLHPWLVRWRHSANPSEWRTR